MTSERNYVQYVDMEFREHPGISKLATLRRQKTYCETGELVRTPLSTGRLRLFNLVDGLDPCLSRCRMPSYDHPRLCKSVLVVSLSKQLKYVDQGGFQIWKSCTGLVI